MHNLNLLLTGATGAVGSALLPKLLADGNKVLCIVRPKGNKNAQERLAEITIHPNAIAVEGDITELGCGVNLMHMPRIDKFIHCAADVRFDEKYAAEIFETNVAGTKNACALAKTVNAAEFHYVGTAYIAGDAKQLDEGTTVDNLVVGNGRNSYELTKSVAEKIVRGEWGKRATVYRPTIVIGRSTDGYTSTFDGYYGFFKGFARLAKRLRQGVRDQHGISLDDQGMIYLPIVIEAVGSTKLNLVHVDWVADTMAKLIELPARGQVYNLSHPSPMSVEEVIKVSLWTLGITDTVIREEGSHRTGNRHIDAVQKMIDAGLTRYRPYVTYSPVFLSRNAKHDLGKEFIPAPKITPEFLSMTLQYAMKVWEQESPQAPSPPSDSKVVHFARRAA